MLIKPQYPIPYKYLTQKDKQLYNKQKAQERNKVKTEDKALAGDNRPIMKKNMQIGMKWDIRSISHWLKPLKIRGEKSKRMVC